MKNTLPAIVLCLCALSAGAQQNKRNTRAADELAGPVKQRVTTYYHQAYTPRNTVTDTTHIDYIITTIYDKDGQLISTRSDMNGRDTTCPRYGRHTAEADELIIYSRCSGLETGYVHARWINDTLLTENWHDTATGRHDNTTKLYDRKGRLVSTSEVQVAGTDTTRSTSTIEYSGNTARITGTDEGEPTVTSMTTMAKDKYGNPLRAMVRSGSYSAYIIYRYEYY